MQQESDQRTPVASIGRQRTSIMSSGEVSQISTLGKLSQYTSVTWGGVDSEGELVFNKQAAQTSHPAMRLPGILSKAGRLCSSHRHLMKFADVYDETRCKQLEEQINYDHLQKLERTFREADVDGEGLDMERFRKAIKKILGELSDEDVDVIFMKVDANCDGSVDWEEYLNYMLREYRGKDDMLKSKWLPEFQPSMKSISVSHSEDIVRIQFFPSQTRGMMDHREKWRSSSRPPSGRFLTVSRDGILHYWSDTFKMLRTVYLDQTKRRHSLKLWVIDMLCLPNLNLLAVSTTDQDIEFFDIGGSKCDRLFSLVDLDGCATAMDYWTDGCKGVFCVGDLKGNVLIFTSTDVVTNGLFNIRGYIGGLGRVPVHLLMKGKTLLYRNFTVSAVHGDWCQQVMYIPQLNVVASCTPAEKSAMALTSLPLHNIGKIQSALIVLRKGILCFDYSPEMNIVVTGGYDPLIRIWNPYVTNSPITHLKGHLTAVTHIMINGQKKTIVSISKDKNIRIWDLMDHFCLQSIPGRNVPLGNCPISSVYYHRRQNVLVCATYKIGLFFGAEFTETELKTQEPLLCCALYNKIFKQAVSGYYNGIVTVWDILTGQKIMEFATTTTDQALEMTAMIFDPPERRLITALKNGMIKLWNFNNGACLMEIPFEEKTETNCIFYMNHRIFITDWTRRVTWYRDSKDENNVIECKHWKSYHAEDILSMDGYANKLLVTSSSNGDVVLWYVNSGQAFLRFNASESPLPLLPKREFATRPDPLPQSNEVKKVETHPSENEKKYWAYPRTSSHSAHPARPTSAKTLAVSSSPTKRPSSAVFGSRSTKPQAAWISKDNLKSSNVLHPPVGMDTSFMRRESLSWQEEIKASQRSVEKVLFLKTRERKPHMAVLLTSCMDGYLYAWSVESKGGMLGKFRASHGTSRDSVVCTMSTDEKELILLTGDSLGYIKIWDIMYYCTGPEVQDSKLELPDEFLPKRNPFCDLIPDYCRIASVFSEDKAIQQQSEGWVTNLIPPVCLSSWRGHLKNIISLRYVEKFKAVLTASHDGTIKLWLLTGRHMGAFGQSLWNLELSNIIPAEVPDEIRHVASLHTLKVLNEGRQPHWESTRKIVKTLSQQRKQQSLLMDLLSPKSTLSIDAVEKMQDLINRETRMSLHNDDQIEASFQRWEESGKKSDILGLAYKQKARRPLLKQLPEVKASVANKDQARIYHCIQYTDLHPLISPQIPDVLAEAQQMQALADIKGMRKGKRWMALTGVMKPTVKNIMLRRNALSTRE
ncbi:EF-hand calcium-binding domain-containing protein 8 [Erythrolamprus reginae]|uniref:EF-hand calcium-binding domain-containing protein 8 n=1 Tax=Erythrolamprus reginae TaxID=121349 RepID=UPI00396C9BC1